MAIGPRSVAGEQCGRIDPVAVPHRAGCHAVSGDCGTARHTVEHVHQADCDRQLTTSFWRSLPERPGSGLRASSLRDAGWSFQPSATRPARDHRTAAPLMRNGPSLHLRAVCPAVGFCTWRAVHPDTKRDTIAAFRGYSRDTTPAEPTTGSRGVSGLEIGQELL